MKVLCPTDGSKLAQEALEAFVSRSRWFHEAPSIELVFVHPAIPYGRAAAWAGKENVEKYYSEEADAALAPSIELLKRNEVAFHVVKLVGEPDREIVRHAEHAGCDLIAMGTRGHTGMANLVLGSVAMKVVATAKVPVLLMR
jgi:nucleotide-binding universal stress UspA family protein